MGKNDLVEVAVEVVHETTDAIKCDAGLDDFVWIPKSQIHDESEVWSEGDQGVLVIPEWLALDKGLV